MFQENVLSPALPKADIINASNFSYFFFKERNALKAYFKSCRKKLNRGGLLFLDLFGGSLCQEPNQESAKKSGFTYYWDQESYDPIQNHAVFHIHFKPHGKKKYKNIFTYDWRMWTIPEVREVLEDAGFSKTHVYWEGSNSRGEGNGIFSRAQEGEDCASWVAYVVGEK